MSIIGTFPITIANGQIEDATVVMSLFSWIQSQTNGNGCPATTGSAVLKGDGAGGTTAAVAGTDYVATLASGMLFDFAGGSVPYGYLACDGSAVSRTTYAALFAAISTTWGVGDGTTTFNVPDLRRKTTIGAGGTAVSGPANTVGAMGGAETQILVTANLPGHTHGFNVDSGAQSANHTHYDSGHVHSSVDSNNFTSRAGVSGGPTPNWFSDSTGSANTGTSYADLSTESAVHHHNVAGNTDAGPGLSGTPHNIMQPSAVVTKIIKT